MTIYEYWESIGYTPITTFWNDFSIAEKFMTLGFEQGPNAIEDTYKHALEYAKTDYKVFYELVLVLNHKIWYWYQKDDKLGIIYDTLWKMCENEFFDYYEGNDEAISYYCQYN